MAKFVYGNLLRTLPQKGALPGQITSSLGQRLLPVGIRKDGVASMEFGEVVEITAESSKSLVVEPVDAATTGNLAIIVRDVVGAPVITGGIIENPRPHVPFSLWLGKSQYGKIVAILGASQTPAINGTVYVGKGTTAATVAGVVYTTDVNSECIETTWKFASTRYAPTESGAYVVEIIVEGVYA